MRRAGQDHEDLERRRRRQERRDEHRQHPEAVEERERARRPRAAEAPLDQGVAALPADGVHHEAAGQRAQRRHRRVERHQFRLAGDAEDQQQVVDLRQRQERRVERRDEEEAGGAQGSGDGLYPGEERLHDHDRLSRLVVPRCLLVRRCRGARHRDRRGVALRGPRSHAQPLRRQGPPRRRPAHRRLAAAGLVADRRRVAAAPPSSQHGAGPGRRLVSHRRVRGRDLRGQLRARRGHARVAGAPGDGLARRRRRRRHRAGLAARRSLPAVDADDRAAADGADARRRRADVAVGRRRWRRIDRRAGTLLALACLTRYEAWPITAAAIGSAALALVTTGVPTARAVRRIATLAVYPIAAVLAFLLLSRATVGAWLVTGGFFVADNPDYHRPFKSMGSVWWGMRQLERRASRSGSASPRSRSCSGRSLRDRSRRALLVTLRARRLRRAARIRLLQRAIPSASATWWSWR